MGISVNPYLMLLVFVCFIVLLVLLNQWLYKPLLKFMDDRDAMINKDLHDIKGSAQEIAEIEKQIANVLGEAQKEAKTIIDKATAQARALSESTIAQKKQELDAKMVEFHKELATEQENLKKELLGHIGEYKQSIQAKLQQV